MGRAIARAFLVAGAQVAVCARNARTLRETVDELGRSTDSKRVPVAIEADASRPDQAERAVAEAADRMGGLDVVVNCAGIQGPVGRLEDLPWEDWARTIEVNLYATVLVCRAAIPRLGGSKRGKIINVSGGGATAPRPAFSAYAASKAAVVRFTETLAEEVRDRGIDVNAMAPGALATRMQEEIVQAGPQKVGDRAFAEARRIQDGGGTPLETPAALAVWLASAESDGISGRLISAVWDPWPALARRRDELMAGDIYTLRRVVPKDRGKDWDA